MLVDVVHLNLGIDRHYEILGVDELWAATLHRIDEHDFCRYGFGVFQPSCGKGFGCEWCIEYGLYGRCVFLCDRFCRFLMYRDTSRGSRFSCLRRSCRNIPFKSCRPYGCGSVCSLRFFLPFVERSWCLVSGSLGLPFVRRWEPALSSATVDFRER